MILNSAVWSTSNLFLYFKNPTKTTCNVCTRQSRLVKTYVLSITLCSNNFHKYFFRRISATEFVFPLTIESSPKSESRVSITIQSSFSMRNLLFPTRQKIWRRINESARNVINYFIYWVATIIHSARETSFIWTFSSITQNFMLVDFQKLFSILFRLSQQCLHKWFQFT